MARFTFHCWSCGDVVEAEAVFRSDTCKKCGQDIKVCKTCRHFDEGASSGCRETSADFVYDKTRANFCSYYAPREDRVEVADEIAAAKAKLDALFGKK